MSESEGNITAAAEQTKSAEQPKSAAVLEPRRYVRLAMLSLLVTVLAWIGTVLSPWLGIVLSVGAIALGIPSLRSCRHSVRNVAITSIIASAVLFVVVAAFMIIIGIGLRGA